MIKYYKLFHFLEERGMKKSDLLSLISPQTLSKLSKGKNIQTDVINKLCEKLKCQPGDIMEYVPDEEEMKKKSIGEMLKKSFTEGMDYIKEMPDEEFEEFKNKDRKEKRKESKKEWVDRTL